MTAGVDDDGAGTLSQSVGERLRAAREATNLELNDIATRTRVPLRHLHAIERSDYSALPSPTYAIGFVRAFARAVSADEVAFARDVRAELGRAPADTIPAIVYEPSDPSRVPSRLLAYTAAAIAVVLIGGYLAVRNDVFGSAPAVPVAQVAPARPSASPSPLAVATPPKPRAVMLTAKAPVWLRIYDKGDKVLLEGEMKAGQTFAVPPDADRPMVRTGRADAITVTVDGQEVAPLGPPQRTIRDVEISAAALAVRDTSPAATPARL